MLGQRRRRRVTIRHIDRSSDGIANGEPD